MTYQSYGWVDCLFSFSSPHPRHPVRIGNFPFPEKQGIQFLKRSPQTVYFFFPNPQPLCFHLFKSLGLIFCLRSQRAYKRKEMVCGQATANRRCLPTRGSSRHPIFHVVMMDFHSLFLFNRNSEARTRKLKT